MNTTLEMIPYTSSSSEMSNEETMVATGLIALATLAVATLQNCSTAKKTTTDPLKISIPPDIQSAPTTPTPPPRSATPPPAPARPKKVVHQYDDELDVKIVRFLRFNPGSTVKEMLKTFKTKDPSLTKSDINSRLYTMLKKNILRKEGDTGAPNWNLT